jgi:hypothetical protein
MEDLLIPLVFLLNFSARRQAWREAAGAIDNKESTDIVNPQSLITPRHALLLVISSFFARALIFRFSFFSKISRFFRVSGAALTCRN